MAIAPLEDPAALTEYLMTLKEDIEPPKGFVEEYYKVDDNTSIRCLRYVPDNPKFHVLVVPGLNTLLMSWYKFIVYLRNEGYEVTYIETREKITSKMENKKDITEQQFLDEITQAVQHYSQGKEYAVVGASMGSNNLIKCMNRGMLEPKYAFLTGTLTKFKLPRFVNIVKPFFGNFSYKYIFLPLILLIVLPSISNKKKDPFQRVKYRVALKSIDPVKTKYCFYAYTGTEVLNDLGNLDKLDTKIFFVSAGEDPLHGDETTHMLVDNVSTSTYIQMETNAETHDWPMVDLINKTIADE